MFLSRYGLFQKHSEKTGASSWQGSNRDVLWGYGVGMRKPRWSLTEVMNLLVSLTWEARFENPPYPETIGSDLLPSVPSQALTQQPEDRELPVKSMGHDSSATVQSQCSFPATEGPHCTSE